MGSGWTGWIVFAAVVAIIVGVFDIVQGLAALLNDEYFLVTDAGLLVWDFTAWGWITLIFGIVLVLIGAGLLSGSGAARWTAVVLLSLNAGLQLAFLAAFPLWSILIIALSVIVLYALIVKWDEAVGDLAT